MDRPLSSVMLAEAYGTFLLTFIGATSITVASDANLFTAGPSLGLGFIGLALASPFSPASPRWGASPALISTRP